MRIEEPGPGFGSGTSSIFHPPSSLLSPIGIDIDPEYCRMALRRLDSESGPLFARAAIEYHTAADLLAPANVPAVADAPALGTSPGKHRRGFRGAPRTK